MINLHIRASEGFKQQALAPKTKEFWRQDQISEKQFLEMADTFDILLFKCNTSGGRIIRTYTGSEFGEYSSILAKSYPVRYFLTYIFLYTFRSRGNGAKVWI